jgi:phosphatidylserine/phosphatidylglycerophosphate/cardiolipin synthase-like enzyme
MVIDGETVIMVSLNFTRAAQERNAEKLLVFHNPALAAAYGGQQNLAGRRAESIGGSHGSRKFRHARRLPEIGHPPAIG